MKEKKNNNGLIENKQKRNIELKYSRYEKEKQKVYILKQHNWLYKKKPDKVICSST